MNSQDSITSKQLIFIIIGSQVGVGVFSLPRLVSMEARQDAWLSLLLGLLGLFLILIIIERLGRRMPESNFVEMNHRLFGRWLGSVAVFLFIAYVVFFLSTTVRMFSEVSIAFLLPRTPLAVVALVVVLTAIYVISKGVRVLARLSETLFWIILPLLFVILLPLANADYTNLLPVGESGFMAIARGAWRGSYAYAGIEVLLIFYFMVKSKDEVIKAGITGLSWTAFLYLFVTLVCLMVWDSELIQIMNWPAISAVKTVKTQVMERPELLLLLVWTMVAIRPILILGFTAVYSLSEVLSVARDKYFHLVVIAVALPVYILALWPSDLVSAFKWTEYAGNGFLLAGFLYPLLMLLIAVIRGKGGLDV